MKKQPKPQYPKTDVHLQTDAFKDAVSQLRTRFDTVVETGTNDGTGSTRIFAEAGFSVHTCEMDPVMVERARKNLADCPRVKCYHAISHDQSLIDPYTRAKFGKDLFRGIQHNWLADQIRSHGSTALYFLDSHWLTGFAEFSEFIQRHMGGMSFTILLDDATNLKHRPSVNFLERMYDYPWDIYSVPGERWVLVELN